MLRYTSLTIMNIFNMGPGFTISYKPLPPTVVCPSSTLLLEASTDRDNYLKGVNLDGGADGGDCVWNIQAPHSGMVVKVEDLCSQGISHASTLPCFN